MSTRLRRTLRICAASLSMLVGALGAEGLAESAGPIRLAVGAPAGGSIDVYSRIIAEHMSATLGRPVIIEIKAGANGNLAAHWVADGLADGSQVWVAAQSMIEINPSSYRNLRWKRSDFSGDQGDRDPARAGGASERAGHDVRAMGGLGKGQSRQALLRQLRPGHDLAFSRLPARRALRPRLHAGALSRQRPADDRSARGTRAVRLH